MIIKPKFILFLFLSQCFCQQIYAPQPWRLFALLMLRLRGYCQCNQDNCEKCAIQPPLRAEDVGSIEKVLSNSSIGDLQAPAKELERPLVARRARVGTSCVIS